MTFRIRDLTDEEKAKLLEEKQAKAERHARLKALGLERSSEYSSFEETYIEHNLQRAYYHGGVPFDDVPYQNLPYPPPDTYRVYQPTGPLGEAITARLEHEKLSSNESIIAWTLIEREEETGYSEYTMESDFHYQIALIRGHSGDSTSAYEEFDFESISKIIEWIEAKK